MSDLNRDPPPIDRWRADAILEPDCRLIGAERIAHELGVSARTVKRWVRNPQIDIPVTKIGGRYSAFLADLRNWMRVRRAA